MKYVDRLIREKSYLDELNKIDVCEKNRIYCRHGIDHLLAVARIMYITALEEGVLSGMDGAERRELIYLTALLHDIGRGRQYQEGIPHDMASAAQAERLLAAIGYPKERAALILSAVAGHRKQRDDAGGEPCSIEGRSGEAAAGACDAHGRSGIADELGWLLRRADRLSRNCYCCKASQTCYWSGDRKNAKIII